MIFAFAAALGSAVYGRTFEQEKEAVRNYLDVLDSKLEKAKKQNQSAKVNLLHALKVKTLALVAEEEPVVDEPVVVPVTVVLVAQPALLPPASYILYWVILGLLIGGAANFVAPGSRHRIAGSIFLAIIGAVIGGYMGQTFVDVRVTGFNISSFTLAVTGSLIMILIDRLLRSRYI